MTIFAIPAPVKAVFDYFPLEIYPPIPKNDAAMNYEFQQRTYNFQGPNATQDDINRTFKLGVYNVFYDSDSGCALATDPWCLYTQLSLCKKNSLELPKLEETAPGSSLPAKPQHSLALLSPLATQDATLPVLIEGWKKRYIRSSDSIHETLKSRAASDPQELMYISLLDHVVYDCWITQVLYHLDDKQFLQLYSFQSSSTPNASDSSLFQGLIVQGLKSSLIKRNEFHLRHKVLAKNIESDTSIPYKSANLHEVLRPILERCERVLSLFESWLQDGPFPDSTSPTYLELKIASYVLCIMNLPPSVPLRIFLQNQCMYLVNHSRTTLNKLQ